MVLGGCKTYKNSIFRTRCEVVEKKMEPEPMEDEKDDGIVIYQPETNWLPGERLLQRINKDKKRSKKKARRVSRPQPSADDIDLISASMSRLVAELS